MGVFYAHKGNPQKGLDHLKSVKKGIICITLIINTLENSLLIINTLAKTIKNSYLNIW